VDLQSVAIKLSRSENLPVLSQVAQAVIKLADDPNASPKALERLMERDASISAKILKVANSSYYGSNQVASVGRAISVLGLNTVKSLVTSIAYQQVLTGKPLAPSFDKVALWRHSLATATAARILGKLKLPLKAEELYSAGMMHDVGLMVMERFAPEELEQCLKTAIEERAPLHEVERRILGFDHAEVGGLLADCWSLTPTVRNAILYHHNPIMDETSHETTALVSAANTLAHQCGFSILPEIRLGEFDPVAQSILDLPEDQLEVIRNVLQLEISRAQEAFHLTAA
jgi:HD-like signal output (HDOD) protein